MDGVVGRNSGESSSRIGRKGRLSWPKEALIYGRPSERKEEAVTHYQEAGRWVHTLRAGGSTLLLPPPPPSSPVVNCGGFEYFARTSTLSPFTINPY